MLKLYRLTVKINHPHFCSSTDRGDCNLECPTTSSPSLYRLLTVRTFAVEGVDLVDAFAVVQAGLAGTLVCVNMAEDTFVP